MIKQDQKENSLLANRLTTHHAFIQIQQVYHTLSTNPSSQPIILPFREYLNSTNK
jgi:hypothetical protein